MLVPCEIAVKSLLPSVRAVIAKKLITKHNLKQTEVAEILGVSQPAISLYNRKIRGKAVALEDDTEVAKLVENMADLLAKGKPSHQEFIIMFCEICKTVRKKGLMCQLHKAFDPEIDIEKCDLCASIGKCL